MLIPDHETEVDFLNCEAISRTVVQLLAENRNRALTIGIHGDWGAGKSSVLKMIECGLRGDKGVACLWFNGWAFQGFDDAKTVLIEATINELSRQRSGVGKVKELAGKLIRRVDWLKVAKRSSGLAFTAFTGLPSPDQIENIVAGLKATAGNLASLSAEEVQSRLTEAATFLKAGDGGENVPEAIHQFREEFSELLEEAKIKQLVVLIDDLDRCLPSTAIETLEAIRLFLFVPRTAFVIGADEAMIEYAVRQHFPDLPLASGPMPYARNYLEKLIQVPFRIPALGIQETRSYVLLLLVQAIVGEDHIGFHALLEKAKEGLNKPWLGSGVSQEDVRRVEPGRRDEIDAAFVLAHQIGPILAEGTKGNPRQIKRFLNALLIRQMIARARGFEDLINQPVLAKLMLAERFQPDFYEHIAGLAMMADNGQVPELAELEEGARSRPEPARAGVGKKPRAAVREPASGEDTGRWLEREWLKRWLRIEPTIAGTDLRPYIFVARDKRMLSGAAGLGGLEALVEKLSSTALAIRSVEPEVKSLPASDAEAVFAALRERVLRSGNFSSPPPGFEGAGILVKHHPRYQAELMALVGSLDTKTLGIWVVKGWNEVITEPPAKEQLQAVMTQWANQDDNALLKKAAGQALGGLKIGGTR